MLKNSKEIFDILSRGSFISQNSVDPVTRKYFDLIEDDFNSYKEYYEGVGFVLNGGNGYFYFSRNEIRVFAVDKLTRFCDWIDRLDFLKTYNSAFESGFIFTKTNIQSQISCDMELKDKSSKLYPEKKSNAEIVDKLVEDLVKMGFVELENEMDGAYKVTAAFHYLDEMVNCLNIVEDADEIPE
ncbi:MAG: hypothetical protein MJZ76_02580 [Bacteroidales bacterium]|nr:hypothetical protein [Bacteroidales bacterium]